MRVLNVGGGNSRDIPPIYKGWEQQVLDINPNIGADIVCDAKDMANLKPAITDAVYCSHTLEHFYRHDVRGVLTGFRHVLKKGGFAHIVVPNVMMALREMVKGNRLLDDACYQHQKGPISYHEMLYGWKHAMRNGNLYYAHKCAFSAKALGRELREAQFKGVYVAEDAHYNVVAFAFVDRPTKQQLQRLGV